NVANGFVVQEIKYSEFGEVLENTNQWAQPFGFAGGLYDYETGLVRFGARDYDGRIGRWIQKDPIGFDGGDTNLYGYVLNDPVNLVDPKGKNPWGVVLDIVQGIMGLDYDDVATGNAGGCPLNANEDQEIERMIQ